MTFAEHSTLRGMHSFLSASKHHWTNYDDDKLIDAFHKHLAAARGTRLHEFAKDCILLGKKLQRSRDSVNQFVNDAIGYKMTPEQILYYSDNCFGTADAISFRQNMLRIHDLKTGETPTSMKQLEVYMSMFCLEYDYAPEDINAELRIYQMGEINAYVPNPEDIRYIMNRIIVADKLLDKIKSEV